MGKFCHMATFRSSSRNTEKINKYLLSNIELVLTNRVSKLGVLGIVGKLLVPSITLCKKFKFKKKITAQGLPKIQLIIIWLIEILRVNNIAIYTCIMYCHIYYKLAMYHCNIVISIKDTSFFIILHQNY